MGMRPDGARLAIAAPWSRLVERKWTVSLDGISHLHHTHVIQGEKKGGKENNDIPFLPLPHKVFATLTYAVRNPRLSSKSKIDIRYQPATFNINQKKIKKKKNETNRFQLVSILLLVPSLMQSKFSR